MSTYITRNIEVYLPIYNKDNLDSPPITGEVRYFIETGSFKEWNGIKWKDKEPEYKWTWVKQSFSDSGGKFRDDVLGIYSPYDYIKERGLPRDCDPELKAEIRSKEYVYNITWMTLEELSGILEKELLKLKLRIQESTEKSILVQKINRLENLIQNKPGSEIVEPDYYDSLDYIIDEETLPTILAINSEITRITQITEQIGWIKENNIRIIYYYS